MRSVVRVYRSLTGGRPQPWNCTAWLYRVWKIFMFCTKGVGVAESGCHGRSAPHADWGVDAMSWKSWGPEKIQTLTSCRSAFKQYRAEHDGFMKAYPQKQRLLMTCSRCGAHSTICCGFMSGQRRSLHSARLARGESDNSTRRHRHLRRRLGGLPMRYELVSFSARTARKVPAEAT